MTQTATADPAAPVGITADHARTRLLEPAMDSVALNRVLGRLIDHPETPEADSILEILVLLETATHRLSDLAHRAAEAVGLQLEPLHEITGYADRLTTALHDAECNGGARTLAGRKLAAFLRPIVDAVGDDDHVASIAATTELFLLFAQISEDMLFREACTYQLGARRTDLLRDLHAQWKERRDALIGAAA